MSEAMFDTGILIDALCGVKPAQAELMRYSRRFISRVTWMEILSLSAPDDARRSEEFMDHFTILEVDEEIGRRAATLRTQRPGLTLPDAIILATALLRGRVLITRNTQDFPANMPGIRVPYSI